MSRSAADRIADIRTAVAAIRDFERHGREEPMVSDAVRMRLLEIGEAVGALSPELTDTEPDVPWRAIVGMRNWMAHRYFDTIHAYVWSTVDQDLDPLLTALDRMADRASPRQSAKADPRSAE